MFYNGDELDSLILAAFDVFTTVFSQLSCMHGQFQTVPLANPNGLALHSHKQEIEAFPVLGHSEFPSADDMR
ncbi:hypothetical protein CK203_045223 [Vitis vinifera]|uniref:Uncharacterized protein n=1 Tax=Vitis vinifera TaxID=29760 RepID=A0A438H3Q8_VITVI|nr:hypothetical protein CK203_045223 [Vitis vinifera]